VAVRRALLWVIIGAHAGVFDQVRDRRCPPPEFFKGSQEDSEPLATSARKVIHDVGGVKKIAILPGR